MIEEKRRERPVTHATVSLHRSGFSPDKVDVTLKLTVVERETITRTLNEADVNPFLAEYGLSPVDLELLKVNKNRQITEVIDLPDVNLAKEIEIPYAIDGQGQK